MSEGVIVVKLGGSTLGAHDTSLSDCAALHRDGRPVVVVHGGGATVSDWLQRLDVPAEWVDGLRKTTAASRDVVVAVLAGLINTTLVQQLTVLGARAVGLTGADATSLCSPASPRGLGLVGETPQADPALLRRLLSAGYLPVVAPIGPDARRRRPAQHERRRRRGRDRGGAGGGAHRLSQRRPGHPRRRRRPYRPS